MTSDLSKAKGLGSAKSGMHHWIHQRFTGLLMALLTLPLSIFFYKLNSVSLKENIIYLLQTPFYVLSYSIFAIIGMYHGMLGIKVIIEDYVHSRSTRLIMVVLLQLVTILSIAVFIIAILYVIR